jgi:hemerythrin-like domain-containing protein
MRLRIKKENEVIFPLAGKTLTPEDQQSLSEAFAKVESEKLGEGVHEKYEELVRRLDGK